MNNFEDRQSKNINRRVLTVNSIEKDDNNEITEMVVTIGRADEEISVIGTELTATNISSIVNNRISEIINNSNNQNDSEVQILNYILNNLNVPTTATYTFDLPGEDIITWSINDLNVSCVVLEGNTVRFLSVSEDVTVNFLATCTINSTIVTKVFPILLKFQENIITQSSYSDEWDQMSTTTNKSILMVNSSKELIYVEVLGDSDLFNTIIINNSTMNPRIEITEKEELKNTQKINQTENFIFTIKVYLDSDYTTVLETRTFTINYKYQEITITPEIFEANWVQEKGVVKHTDFTVIPCSTEAIYVEVVNYNSNLLTLTPPYNLFGGNSMRFKFEEKTNLNNMNGSTTMNLNFLVKVFLDSDRSVLIKEIPGVINYTFASTDPLD